MTILAEQIRRRGRIQGIAATDLASQSNVNEAAQRAEATQASLIDKRIQAFSTSLSAVYEPKIAVGSTNQYLRGDKTWQLIQQGDVSGLTSALASKAASAHIHAINDISGLSSALSGLSDAAAAKVAKAGDTMTGPLIMPSYLKAALPSASSFARSLIYVSDLTGGAEFCYSDGSSWRRISDRSLAN